MLPVTPMGQLQLPELVRDTELRTRFETPYTIHEFLEGPYSLAPARREVWKRLKTIGQGGFSYVCLEECVQGHAEDTPQTRAVKVISSRQDADAMSYSRELEAVAKFSQKKFMTYFVKSFGWYRGPEDLFISLEYFPLGDLQSYMNQTPLLPEDDVRQIARQILYALSILHEEGFAHRDLKPANILIKSCPPSAWWIKLGDFGLSKRATVTQMPSIAGGTPGFMAPDIMEILLYRESGDRSHPPSIPHDKWVAADLWSLGETLVRMVLGKAAFRSHEHLMGFYLGRMPFPLCQSEGLGLSLDMLDFIQQAMTAKATDRITSHAGLSHPWVEVPGYLKTSSLVFPPQAPAKSLSNHSVSEREYRSWTTSEFTENTNPFMASSASTRAVGVSQNMTFQPPVKRKLLPSQRIVDGKSLSNAAPEAPVKVSPLVETQAERSVPNNIRTRVPITLTPDHSQSCMEDPPTAESVVDSNSVNVAEPVISGQYLPVEQTLLETGRVNLQPSPLQTVKTFKEKVCCVEFLPDSRRLLVASGKDIYYFDELNQPVETKRLDSSHGINYLAISPDSCYAAVATDHEELRVADLRTGLMSRTITTLKSGSQYLAFSRNSEIIVCGLNDKSLILVERETGQVIKKLKSFISGHKGPVTWSSFTREGRIVSLCSDGYLCEWDNRRDYKLGKRVLVGDTLVLASAESSNTIALAASENVHIWQTEPLLARSHQDITYRNGGVGSLNFLPCGTRLLLSREHGDFELWRLTAAPELIATLSGRGWNPTWTLCATSLASDTSHVAMAKRDGTVLTLDIQNAIRVDNIRMHTSLAVFTSISGDGTKVASICSKDSYKKHAAHDGTVIIWDLQTKSATHFLQIKTNGIQDAVFSPDSQRLAVISTDGSATIWAVRTGKLTNVVGRPFHSDYSLACAAISLDFCLLATVEYNEIHWGIRVWNIENGTTRCFLGWYEINKKSFAKSGTELRYAPKALRFLDDSSRLVAGNWHGIYICNIGQGSMQYHSSKTSKQAYQDPMGRLIRRKTRFTDPGLEKEKGIVQKPYHWNADLVVSPDSETAAFLSDNGTAYLYDLKTQQEPSVFRGWYGSGRVAISPDWQFLVTTSHENKVLIWNISSGDIIEILHTAKSPARAVMFSPDSRLIFILSEGQLLMYDTGSPQPPRVWDYNTGSIIQTFKGYESGL
ncbi:hypothetical protein FOXB_04726 [Fusarium oxysporum f. sp. conglutinans Fo5176]|uniref:Protein kinase domain-containing protein n=1 Tax=Fusarium oxysporum (strain Fo5176) TaxID=660025 RepID=F9FE98_FUSOF|nr:hypothetical protein FOXB_04726 [Fusarium oxysporum f. sp. conglutinans Fo5176]